MSSDFGVRRQRRRFGLAEIIKMIIPKRRRAMLAAALQIGSLALCIPIALQPIPVTAQTSATVTVTFPPGHPANRFIPARALGAGVDGHSTGQTVRQLSPATIKAMLSAGPKPLTYRLRTELAGEAWHWNPNGTWSDPARRQGYWTSNSKPGRPIHVCYGYRLPRRGNTIDQANDDGYSRLDDGDTESFWKSNPYLDKYFTGEPNSHLAQWLLIDLGAAKPVDAIRLLWGAPFATRYDVEYGRFSGANDISQRLPNEWKTFPRGRINGGTG